MTQKGRLERNIPATVEYQDITRDLHSHDWEIDPALYVGLRTMGAKDMGDLVIK